MKLKTAELTGAALDWAVAKCEGAAAAETSNNPFAFKWEVGAIAHYSTDWSQGGPIMYRERIATLPLERGAYVGQWSAAYFRAGGALYAGATPLIAAMRCYVASELGEEVEVPDELAQA